jgi:SpoIID/LytB domain protein
MKARTWRIAVAGALAVAILLGTTAATPATAALSGNITISGHGFGHGRGLSQYGSLGYAVDHVWNHRQILAHYYGGTEVGGAPNNDITVELLSQRNTSPALVGAAIHVNGMPMNAPAVQLRRFGPNAFGAFVGPGCGGPWVQVTNPDLPNGTTITSNAPATGANVLKVCEANQARGYRGAMQVFEGSGGILALVNRLPIEEYLLGVVPRESPASWGDAGAGRGINALKAQAVAARSYALAGGWNSYAKTCDTTSCQVYQGTNTMTFGGAITSLEHPNTNRAVAETATEIRVRGSATVRTEFSSSTGGWTAGGDFPAVQDLGDGTASNPNRNWSVDIDAGTLAGRLGVPPITGITITQRNGLGADGGRVLSVAVDTTGGRHTLTGNQFRSRAGLKSDWFSVSYSGVNYAQALSYVRAVYTDVLQRPAAEAEASGWANVVATSKDRTGVARSVIMSQENLYKLVAEIYQGGLHRAPDPEGHRTWVNFFQAGRSINDLNAAIYGSYESVLVLGNGDNGQWVDGMYLGLLGRSAAPAEKAAWTDVANTQGRSYVAFNISSSVEARQRRLNGYYTAMLGRSVDETGLRGWVPVMAGRGDFDVQIFILSSPEYWDRAPVRFP